MKTTAKYIVLTLPNGKKEKILLNEFATKEDLGKEVARIVAQAESSYATKTVVEEDEFVAAAVHASLRQAIGADEHCSLSFSGTNYLDGATSVKEALVRLDEAIANK